MFKKIKLVLLSIMCAGSLLACASAPQNASKDTAEDITKENLLKNDVKVATTSVAIAEILEALEYDNVVGVPETSNHLPEIYAEVATIGGAMNPDIELVKSVGTELLLSPKTLEASLGEQYEDAGITAEFLDMSSVQGMYEGIEMLGDLLGREEQAEKLMKDYEAYIEDYNSGGKSDEDCMIIMTFPDGFYLVATEKSYVGNLVALAGGNNVFAEYQGDESGVVSVSPEEMIQKNPDKIFVFAHYNEDAAFAYMKKEFKENSTWGYYDAVKNDEIYYLSSEMFGMSATFDWKESLTYLKPILHGDTK